MKKNKIWWSRSGSHVFTYIYIPLNTYTVTDIVMGDGCYCMCEWHASVLHFIWFQEYISFWPNDFHRALFLLWPMLYNLEIQARALNSLQSFRIFIFSSISSYHFCSYLCKGNEKEPEFSCAVWHMEYIVCRHIANRIVCVCVYFCWGHMRNGAILLTSHTPYSGCLLEMTKHSI